MPMPTPFSSSARLVNSPHIPHAPITETPFDCFGPRGLEPSKLRAQDACNVALMACFGRPMWRPLLLPFSEDALGRFTVGDTPDTNRRRTPSSVVIDPSVLFNDLIDLARAKLVLSALLAKPLAEYSTAAQAAVLDVRVMLSYEPHRATMHGLVMELVVGHMRTAYSLSEYGERLSTGYSSEPILAEAAARQLHEWRRLGLKLDADQPAKVLLESLREAPEPEPALKILEILRDDDQLECEEIGKAVGRLLLTLARDHATYATFPSDPCPNFSSPVPVNTFISRLFSEEVAVQVLNSKPDNMLGNASGTQKTFKEAFANAVVNFTHFTKWTGLSGLTDHVALACFVRSMAFVCETSRGIVDAFIPVLLDKDAPLDASVMTGLLVRINLSKRASAMAAYEINETTIGLFSAEEDAATVRRPYVALVMELGLAGSELAGDLTPQESPDAPPQRVSFKSSGEYWDMDEEHVHHRYSVLAYGCSPAVYGVVGEGDRALYKSVLRSGLLGALGHHPRQDATSLGLARKVSPFFGLGGGSWSWISNSYLNREVRDGLEEEGGVIIWRADGHDGDEGKRDVDEDVRMSEVAE
ncbi:hypothetical protein C8Q76DRAFT_429914 [Earliella scabrosa]|nr:hypothetical protein C8Q76DRAFT_429914 [Earliella scabrosa]